MVMFMDACCPLDFSVACIGFLIILLIIIVLIVFWAKRMKRRNFMQNGGLQLQEFIKSKGHDHTLTRIFTGSELKAATNNYAEDMKIGTGGFGAVYKGKLETGKLVAIKKALVPGDGDNKEFLNEVMILTQIHHKHIVKLLGCCLETKTPLLVYEYASNGTLGDHLQETSKNGYVMGWDRRLAVATQTAEALSYLHRAASPPILHRDVKAANILLDDNWDAKVGDFGVSRLLPDGDEHISTAVQGTLGYLDPEYFQTLQLTDKSDVYSMGVMLVELITSLKPVDTHNRDAKFSNLALLFIHHIKEGILEEIIDPRLEIIDNNVSISQEQASKIRSSILGVASLAHRCLALIGNDRPSMMEVEHELHEISRKLHATGTAGVSEESLPFVQSYEAGAVIMDNNEYVIHSDSYSHMDGSKIYGISTQLPR